MKNLKSVIAAVALMAFSTSAFAAGETAKRPLKSTEKMRVEIFDRVEGLRMNDFELKDATVEVSFFVNADGDLAIESIECDNCVVKSYVAQKLQSEKMYVAEELQNTRHSIKIRYVIV